MDIPSQCDAIVFLLGAYQVQTNLSMQTMQTSIWATRSTSKGGTQGEWEGDLQKCDYPIQGGRLIVNYPISPYLLDVDPVAQI